jgi:cytochrome P450
MTKATPIPKSHSAGVWIDHRRAQIVGLTTEGETARVILSNVQKHPERGGDSPMQGPYEALQVPADDRRQRALTRELNTYYDAVIAALRDYGALLVFGPGEAKGEFHARLLRSKQGDRVVAIETADQMTDRQIVAKVRAYFGDTPGRW